MLVRILVLLPRNVSLGVSISLHRDAVFSAEGKLPFLADRKFKGGMNCPTNFTESGKFPLSIYCLFELTDALGSR
jgi:hypothetical protein